LFRELRSIADIVLVGAQTVRQELRAGQALSDKLRRVRLRDGRPGTPRIVVASRELIFDWSIPPFAADQPESRPLLITSEAVALDRMAEARQRVDVVVAGQTSIDLRRALRGLELCPPITPVMGGDPLVLSLAAAAALAWFSLAHVLAGWQQSLFCGRSGPPQNDWRGGRPRRFDRQPRPGDGRSHYGVER
jgi:5-amino-6-(5-phosphoribosylamino)uracil reductase